MNRHTNRMGNWVAAMVAITWSMAACSEFIETPITNERVALLSPGAGAAAATDTVQFLWEPMGHALHYRLQVASPTFGDAVLFYADTTLEKTSYRIFLAPGRYQWRVKAGNGSSGTRYTTRSFTIYDANTEEQTKALAP
ncbi:hypothetical protein [Parapedobacter sp. 10938]|uniref:hypothetical protein n=1 Tax=Parapedobacter flavus TaxID=3110225 RepID=UPI002DBE48DB|nr:hypothetical protein [Parapedobacter sp. 10938]MEC3882037.1 hypothetical protein [Parapedobacter sp. 10938]